jgi:hypothetical protein
MVATSLNEANIAPTIVRTGPRNMAKGFRDVRREKIGESVPNKAEDQLKL